MNGEKVKIIKYAPPPPDLPIYGQIDPAEVCFFGRTNYESEFESKRFIFGVKRSDRKRHMYIVGKSGVGKTKLLELLVRQDISYGEGLCLIDPYGELIDDILNFIPEERIKDVVLADPSDIQRPFSFNPLKDVSPEIRHQFAQWLTEIIKKQFNANWNLKIEHVFRFICLALLDCPFATIDGMILMITDENYRRRVLECVKDDMVRNFWEVEFIGWKEKFETEAIIPLINKLSRIFSNPLLKNIFNQKENKIDFDKIISEKKILLVNLAKGKLGENSANFFGSLFIAKIYQTVILRKNNREKNREDFYFYISDFHNVITDFFDNFLADARKYNLCLTIAHQYLAQIPQGILPVIMGNIATIIVFRLSADDAFIIEKEMTPVFKAKDMINLGMREFYIKMTIDDGVSDPFSAETLKVLAPTHPSYKDKIVEYNRQNYCVSTEKTDGFAQ
ncbi:MAG: type IV secretion system DNA-binding domain-containing protein [Patescibacteria group bacterium]|nr:type IV secretion system DNA-binding domain-containing protein [Patescibacteria group bacterium]